MTLRPTHQIMEHQIKTWQILQLMSTLAIRDVIFCWVFFPIFFVEVHHSYLFKTFLMVMFSSKAIIWWYVLLNLQCSVVHYTSQTAIFFFQYCRYLSCLGCAILNLDIFRLSVVWKIANPPPWHPTASCLRKLVLVTVTKLNRYFSFIICEFCFSISLRVSSYDTLNRMLALICNGSALLENFFLC